MYKITFTEQELNKFNLVENESIRKSLMSVYMYLLKLNDKKNTQLSKAQLSCLKAVDKLNISFRKFLEAYNRNHSKLSLPTLKSRIDKLKELGLVIIKKAKNSFVYSFYRYEVNKIANDIPNDSKPSQAIENSSVEEERMSPKYLNSERVKDLDSNSFKETVDNFNYNKYIQSQERVTDWSYISNLIEKAFVSMKVRSSWIKGHVIDKIFQNYSNITKKYAMKYICTAISNAREQSESNYNKRVMENSNSITTPSTFNNFSQRSYNFDNLENQLLGVAEYDPEKLY